MIDIHSEINDGFFFNVTSFFLRILILGVITICSFWAVQNLIEEMPIYESINLMLAN